VTPRQIVKMELFDQVIRLTEESLRLSTSLDGAQRRTQIDEELVRLFQKISDLSTEPVPYWYEASADASSTDANLSRNP